MTGRKRWIKIKDAKLGLVDKNGDYQGFALSPKKVELHIGKPEEETWDGQMHFPASLSHQLLTTTIAVRNWIYGRIYSIRDYLFHWN